MSVILRNLSTEQSRSFWETAERSAVEVQNWPAWKRAGINVADIREEAREEAASEQPREPASPEG